MKKFIAIVAAGVLAFVPSVARAEDYYIARDCDIDATSIVCVSVDGVTAAICTRDYTAAEREGMLRQCTLAVYIHRTGSTYTEAATCFLLAGTSARTHRLACQERW